MVASNVSPLGACLQSEGPQHCEPLQLPVGAVLRHVGVQNGNPTLWIEVETSNPTREVVIRGYPTGYGLPEGLHYLGTALIDQGDLVFHLYAEDPLS